MGEPQRVGLRDDIRDDNKRADFQRRFDKADLRHRNGGIRPHDPDRLDASVRHGAKHLDRLEARLRNDARRSPEALYAVAMFGILNLHMGRQHIGEAADFAARPSHWADLSPKTDLCRVCRSVLWQDGN